MKNIENIVNYLPKKEDIMPFNNKNYDKVVEIFEDFFDKKSKYETFTGHEAYSNSELIWMKSGKFKKPEFNEQKLGDVKTLRVEFDGFICDINLNTRESKLNSKANKSIDEVAVYNYKNKEILYLKNNDSDSSLSNAYLIIKKK